MVYGERCTFWAGLTVAMLCVTLCRFRCVCECVCVLCVALCSTLVDGIAQIPRTNRRVGSFLELSSLADHFLQNVRFTFAETTIGAKKERGCRPFCKTQELAKAATTQGYCNAEKKVEMRWRKSQHTTHQEESQIELLSPPLLRSRSTIPYVKLQICLTSESSGKHMRAQSSKETFVKGCVFKFVVK